MSASTPLPQLTWSSATLVNVAPAPGCPTTVRVVQQDDVQRSFLGTISFNPSLGAVDGGLDTGSESGNTWYYLYMVPSAANQAVLAIRGSVTPPSTGPTGYTKWTYIGAVRNDGSSNIMGFFHSKNRFDYAYGPQFLYESAPTTGSLVTTALADYVPLTCSFVYFNLSAWPYNYRMHVTYLASASGVGWNWFRDGINQGGWGGNKNWVAGAPLPTPGTPKQVTHWETLVGGNNQNQTRHVHGWIDGWVR